MSLAAVVFTGLLSTSQGVYFEPFFGRFNPLLVVVFVALLGAASLHLLRVRGKFEIYAKGKCLKGVGVSAIIASLFGILVILVDLSIGFPGDINVPPPPSLLFYPAIAYVAEIIFHALPLSILFITLRPFLQKRFPAALNRVTWICIFLVAILEPVFHTSVAIAGQSFSGLDVYVALHVFAINFLQLVAFWRYDFVSMFSFRFVYYIIWHIVWGYLRLH